MIVQNYNYHTHSIFSDGKSTPQEVVENAIRLGMSTLGFSDHCHLPFHNTFAIQDGMMENYVDEIRKTADNNSDMIKVLCSLEMDFVPNTVTNFAQTQKQYKLDYLIGSVHLIGHTNNPDEIWFIDGPDYKVYDAGLEKFFGNDIRKGVKAFYDQTNQMIENERFDIIGHFDKIKMHNRNRYFTEDEPWYRSHVMETLELIKQKNLIVEINTRGLYKKRSTDFYPSSWILPIMQQMNIPIVIGSDAHHCSELNYYFTEATTAIQNAGYRSIACFENGCWTEKNID